MTGTPDPYDLDNLERLATEAIDDVREHRDEDVVAALGHNSGDFRGGEGTVDTEQFEVFQDKLFDELDELYGVETDAGLREYIRGRTAYDWSTAEHAKRTGRNSLLAGGMVGGLAAGLTNNPDIISDTLQAAQQEPELGAAGLGIVGVGVAAVDQVTKRIGSGSYVEMPYPMIQHKHRDINISPDAEPAAYTFPVTTAEMTHAYQDLWNSPSFSDPVFEEGMDVGTQLAVGYRMDDEDGLREADTAWRRAHVLTFAYGALATEDDASDTIDPRTLEEVGLTADEADAAVATYADHSSSKDQNLTPLLGGAGLYTAARMEGFEVYDAVFHGEYDQVPDWVPYHGED